METKAHFTNRLEISPRPDGETWELAHAFGFNGGYGRTIVVPPHFVTDLASIPRLFWNILPPFGKYTEAAVIHDWIYRTHMFTRPICDAILLQGMGICGVPVWQRWIIYLNVRVFGWFAWHDERRWRKHPMPQLQ